MTFKELLIEDKKLRTKAQADLMISLKCPKDLGYEYFPPCDYDEKMTCIECWNRETKVDKSKKKRQKRRSGTNE